MPGPSVTYTFANSTTADATQVNQNFSDLINGATDGTKDYSISALTCAGTATFNGNVNLGNASGDDLSVLASVASSIPIKTNNSYDVGSSTLGLRSVYIGSTNGADERTVRVMGSSSISASWTLTLPTSAGSAGQFLRTDGSGNTSWLGVSEGPYHAINYGLTASVAANALTVALKAADGNDASGSNAVEIVFRSSTATTGTPVKRTVTAALSIAVSSGATLGHTDGDACYVYVYAIDNAGTVELAVAGSRAFDEGALVTTSGMGVGSDDVVTLYSTTGRTDVPVRFLGRIKSTQTTAGTWASSPSEISLNPSNKSVQVRSEVRLHTGNGYGSTNTKIRRFTTSVKNVGTAITYADSASNGASFTINEHGVYAVSYVDNFNVNAYFGITLNSTELTTNIDSITAADRLSMSSTAASGNLFTTSWVGRLEPGDVIRAHTQGNASGTDAYIIFSICHLSD